MYQTECTLIGQLERVLSSTRGQSAYGWHQIIQFRQVDQDAIAATPHPVILSHSFSPLSWKPHGDTLDMAKAIM